MTGIDAKNQMVKGRSTKQEDRQEDDWAYHPEHDNE